MRVSDRRRGHRPAPGRVPRQPDGHARRARQLSARSRRERDDVLLHDLREHGGPLVGRAHQLRQAVRHGRAARSGPSIPGCLDDRPHRRPAGRDRRQQRQRRALDAARGPGRRVAERLEAGEARRCRAEPLADRSDPRGSSNNVVFLGAQDGNVYAVDASVGAAGPPPWLAPAPRRHRAGGTRRDLHGLRRGVQLPAGRHARVGRQQLLPGVRPQRRAARHLHEPAGPRTASASSAPWRRWTTRRAGSTSRAGARTGGSQNTLWCLQLGAPPNVFTLVWARNDLGDIDSSPVLRGGRVYVGGTTGAARSTRSTPRREAR